MQLRKKLSAQYTEPLNNVIYHIAICMFIQHSMTDTIDKHYFQAMAHSTNERQSYGRKHDKTYIELWNAVKTGKVLNITTVDCETCTMPWTSYQATTKHTLQTSNSLQTNHVIAYHHQFIILWSWSLIFWHWMQSCVLRHTGQRTHSSKNKHSTWQQEFLGCRSENLEQSTRLTTAAWHLIWAL